MNKKNSDLKPVDTNSIREADTSDKFSHLELANTNKLRETYAYHGDNIVIKTSTGLLSKEIWLEKQIYAQEVSNQLLRSKSPNYFIPQTLFILKDEGFSIENKVRGKPMHLNYFNELSEDDKNIIYDAIAHFCNDINQMKPVLTYNDLTDNWGNLDKARHLLSSKEFNTIKQAQTWLKNNAHAGPSIVFSHGDMNQDNIFYDKNKKLVSFIDFADAKYQSVSEMFNNDFAKLEWIDINRLIKSYENLQKKEPVSVNGDEYVVKIYSCLKSIFGDINTIVSQNINFKSALIKTLKDLVEELSKYLKNVKINSLKNSEHNIQNKLKPNFKPNNQHTL